MKICLECNCNFSSGEWKCPKCKFEPDFVNGFLAHAPSLAFHGGGFKAEHFAELASVERDSFWFRARNEIILWALRKYGQNTKSVLEIGCGTGFVLAGISEAIPEMSLSGSEIFVDGLAYAAIRLPEAKLMQMDARQIPFTEEFDVIGAFDVLEHILEDEDVLSQIYNALKPGGLLLLSVPQHPWLWSTTDDHACHVRRYKRNELSEKCSKNGFDIEKSTSFVSFLLPAMLASRQKKKILDSKNNAMDELRLPQLINRFFYAVMRLEQIFIRWGVSFPFGGSRLVVARKAK